MKNGELIEILKQWPLDAEVITLEIDDFDDVQWDSAGFRLTAWGSVAFYHPWNAHLVDDEEATWRRFEAERKRMRAVERAKEDEILRQAEAILKRRNLTGA